MTSSPFDLRGRHQRLTRSATATALAAASALHVAWGRGSVFPYRTSTALSDNVIGSSRSPSPTACYAVACALGSAALLTAVKPRTTTHRAALCLIASIFATRAAFGFAGRTDLLVPGSTSARFRRRDRLVFSPLCAGLAAAIVTSARRTD